MPVRVRVGLMVFVPDFDAVTEGVAVDVTLAVLEGVIVKLPVMAGVPLRVPVTEVEAPGLPVPVAVTVDACEGVPVLLPVVEGLTLGVPVLLGGNSTDQLRVKEPADV